jgi:hypothetical protein
MTNQEVLLKTAASADRWLERQLMDSEISLVDQGATAEELAAALGPHGWWRAVLQQDRDAQIREVKEWLIDGIDGPRH